jgi:type II secretory pathway pseudopilin PulG
MKKSKNRPAPERAFTRLELVMVLASLGLLAGVALPVLANSKSRSEQASCFSNLRQIGRAYHLWAIDHGDANPWLTPYAQGGTFRTPSSLKDNAWFQIAYISNELVTPRILVCPSDRGVGAARKMATDFSGSFSGGGFSAISFRDVSLSYTIGLHTYFDKPRSILSGDRNIKWQGQSDICFTGFPVWFSSNPNSSVVWTNSIHVGSGNVLFNDGAVEELSSLGLQRALSAPNQDDRSSHHFMAPN